MFKVVTRNSVYTVKAVTVGFEVWRSADMHGRVVKAPHRHITTIIGLVMGQPFTTTVLSTTPVLAVLPA